MIAGLVLSDSENEDSQLAFLEDNLECESIKDTGEIVDAIVEQEPEVLAADCGTELNKGSLTQAEEDLKEEGYSFTPSFTEPKRVERLRAIKRSIRHHMDRPPEIIRFDPAISSEELALDSDKSLESLGIDTEDISSAYEFDAVLGAVTARFYSQNQYQDLGVIVPQGLE